MTIKGDKVSELKDLLKKKRETEKKIAERKDHVENHKSAKPRMSSNEENDKIIARLTKAEEEVKKHYDHLLRVIAEFENYKKRVSKENEEFAKFVHEPLLNDLVSIIDDFERVENHVDENDPPAAKAILDGVLMVHKGLQKVLDKYGLKQVETDGKFDPAVHEAIAYIPSDDFESGDIIEVHGNGYLLHNRLIRPAQVTVSRGSE